jgi:hypothetical protein
MTEEQVPAISEGGQLLATPTALAELLTTNVSKYATEEALQTVSKVGDYLPYIQLLGSNSTEVKKGEFPMGHFALNIGQDNRIDLGDSMIILILGWRPKAMQFQPEVISLFDVNSEEFKQMQIDADKPNSGKGYGAEFLVWLPEVRKLACYFLGNKTGRAETDKVMAVIEQGKTGALPVCKQVAILIDPPNSPHAWHGPKTMPHDLEIEMPPMGLVQQELEKFNNPPAKQSQKEEKEEAETDGRE